MKNRILILLVVAATLFACNSDSMISDENVDLQKSSSGKAVERPFKIENLEGTFILGPSPVLCGNSTGNTTLTAEGGGILKYLGASTLLEEWCFNPAVTNDLGTRTITITAANGDELHGENFTINWTSDTSFVETFTFNGGTGRFENASGEFSQEVALVFFSGTNGTFTLNGEGTLKY